MTARERVQGRPLRRAAGSRRPRTTFRLYVEGRSTEPEYVDGLKRLPEFADRLAIAIVIEQAGAMPLTLVQAAVADKKSSRLDVDQYWCVFDVEEPRHPNLLEAVDLAARHDIGIAVSNPCFELWLLLHQQDQTRWLTTKQAVHARGQLDRGTGKHLDPARYLPHRLAAVARAKALDDRHARNATPFPHNNPSSSVWQLIESIERERYTLSTANAQLGLATEQLILPSAHARGPD